MHAETRLVACVCAAEILVLAGFALVPALLPQFIAAWSLSNIEAGWSPAASPAYSCRVIWCAYSMTPEVKSPDVILIATGSEVTTCLKAADELKGAGITASVVSMPSFKVFDEQPESYRLGLLPETTPKVSLEAGATMGWYKYVGHNGTVIGLDRFGASAPGPIAMEKLGISSAHVVEAVKKLVKK